MNSPRPPSLAEYLVGLSAPSEDRLQILGDLHEEFAALARRTPRGATRWYRRQAFTSTIHNLRNRAQKRRRRSTNRRRGDGMIHAVLHDLRYSLRRIRQNWGFALVVVMTLALGIGANTLVYSVVDSVILNPFPFPDPDRLVGVGSEWPRLSRELGFWETLSPQEYVDVDTQSETMEHIVMWDMGFRAVSAGVENTETLFSAFWFDDAFPALGMNAILGRGFSREELERGDRVAILSHRYWQSRLGSEPSVLDKPVLVDGEPYTVIGIMPPDAQIYATDLWIPMGAAPERFPRNRRAMQILARIKPGFTLDDVNAELSAISGRIEREYGAEFQEYAGWRMRALTWTDVNVRLVKPAALALFGAVGFVLLIVCANVASLLLARSASRRKEIAVRRALGADRSRIIRQLLTESVVLAAAGGVAGVAITYATLPALRAIVPTEIPIVIDIAVNHRVLAFTAFVSILAGLIFGLMPALHGSRADVQNTLKAEGSSSTATASRHRLQRLFVGAEFAVALALLVQAGLLANSFVRMQRVDPGFDTANTLTMRLTLPPARYRTGESITNFFQQLVERVEGLPGVREAGAGTQYPPITFARRSFAIEGQSYQNEDEFPTAFFTLVTDGYHEALGIPLMRGRTFTSADMPTTPLVGVVNEAAAQSYFPGEDPIGKRIRTGAESPWVEIVGVVRSVRNRGPEAEPQPEFFANIRQIVGGSNQLFLVVKTERDPRSVLGAVQNVVTSLDPDQSVYMVTTVSEAFDALTAPRRMGTTALLLFAGFALLLAAAGIYAVVTSGVAERTREIGLRIALGASGSTVRRLVVLQAMIPVVVGGVIGLVGAMAAGRALSDFLFEVSGADPLTVVSVTALLGSIAVAASYIPALRASRLSPTVALRE